MSATESLIERLKANIATGWKDYRLPLSSRVFPGVLVNEDDLRAVVAELEALRSRCERMEDREVAKTDALIDARDCMSRAADIIEAYGRVVDAGRLRRSADYCRAALTEIAAARALQGGKADG